MSVKKFPDNLEESLYEPLVLMRQRLDENNVSMFKRIFRRDDDATHAPASMKMVDYKTKVP